MKKNEKTFEEKFKKFLYVAMVITTIIIVFPIAYSYVTTMDTYESVDVSLNNGVVDLTDYDLSEERPIVLKGVWITYSGVYFTEDTVDTKLLNSYTITSLPIRNLNEAQGTCTYQAYIRLDLEEEELEDVVLSIPFTTDSIRVYVNGIYVEGYYSLESWSGFDSEDMVYSLSEAYNDNLEYQIILISVNETETNTDLYNREITISTVSNIEGMAKIMLLLQGMLVAMMFFSIMVAIIYIILLPTYSVLTFMNLFDTALMLHLFFNMCTLPQIVMDTVTLGALGDSLFRRLDLFFLFMAGIFGNTLVGILFDEEGHYNKIFTSTVNGAYVVLMMMYLIFPQTINQYGLGAGVILLGVTFAGAILRFVRDYKLRGIGLYKWFHLFKTLWLGMIVMIDIITINSSNRPVLFLAIAYVTFFFVHIVVRAIEYRAPYLKMTEINENLEKVVEERTIELREANNVLRKISIIDPLTKVYNRMHFEDEFAKSVERYNSPEKNIMSLHVCIFDLDNFKNINDTYGHQAGDSQLNEAIRCARSCVSDDIIISRIGGEEFTIEFIDYTDKHVLETLENIRVSMEKLAQQEEFTTSSFGVTKAVHGNTKKELLSQADRCLYFAKNNGKNQVVYDFTGEMQVY